MSKLLQNFGQWSNSLRENCIRLIWEIREGSNFLINNLAYPNYKMYFNVREFWYGLISGVFDMRTPQNTQKTKNVCKKRLSQCLNTIGLFFSGS